MDYPSRVDKFCVFQFFIKDYLKHCIKFFNSTVVAHYPTKSSTKSFLYVYRLEVKVQDFSMHSNTQTSLSLFGLLGGQVVTTNIEKNGGSLQYG